MGIVIQKFGGTSLRNLSNQSKFLKLVKKEVEIGSKLIVVVSAMGRNGDPYATDTLINQLENISTTINPKKKDLIMSVGETISAALVSHLLESEGLSSEALTGFQAGIITDNTFNMSKIININTNKIQEYLNNNDIVVVAGFQGATKDLEITTLGRGGSDTTAVALGGYLNAERVDIFTDVPGVAITDPRIIPNTRYIKKISYDDMYRFAINGANVIHPNAVLLGKQYNIPIRILSTFMDGSGTLISNDKSDLGIIGFGIKKTHENNSIISFIFNCNYKDEIKEELDKFLLNEKEHLIKLEYFNDKAYIVIKNKVLNEFLQRLYSNFIQ
ncbi:aspartate kinase [Sedimentibacter sp. MB31-C6]|uniref:aspartate kinase n=1 Tax=Sedimentibacter sp. MB31-C6 TaxID=3109366 RepID=UPI002DDD84BD|nr:aspartate kinase [Sedimentibacter sp. MB36-C1]WSI03202.1 aspartate kinase [Sedimentibacter sp. MB36-C1]